MSYEWKYSLLEAKEILTKFRRFKMLTRLIRLLLKLTQSAHSCLGEGDSSAELSSSCTENKGMPFLWVIAPGSCWGKFFSYAASWGWSLILHSIIPHLCPIRNPSKLTYPPSQTWAGSSCLCPMKSEWTLVLLSPQNFKIQRRHNVCSSLT